jgi:hypothetical protein
MHPLQKRALLTLGLILIAFAAFEIVFPFVVRSMTTLVFFFRMRGETSEQD